MFHNADAAHEQRDGGDAAQQQRQDAGNGSENGGKIGKIPDGKIIIISLLYLVPVSEQIFNLAWAAAVLSTETAEAMIILTWVMPTRRFCAVV